MNDKHVSKVSIQSLIREAQERGGVEHPIGKDFRVELRVHGKEAHLWKTLLSVVRHAQVTHGAALTFLTLDNDELVDDLTDDQGEMWHSHDWKADPDPEDEGLHEDKSRESHPAESRHVWMGGGLEIVYTDEAK